MTEKRIHDPAIAYTASRLGDYARGHGINTDKQFTPDIKTLHSGAGKGAYSFRHGYAVTPRFEVVESIPRTIPIVLARLAIFDIRTRQNPSTWPNDIDKNFGVGHSSVSWLRLVNVAPDDERVGEILSIVGARLDSGIKNTEHDQRGNLVPYSAHHYLESDLYAVKVAECALEQHLGLPVTSIGFILPDRFAL